MGHDELIPPGVAEHDAALLRRAYALTSQDEGAQLYREWAETYDRTMLDGLGYVSPRHLTALFARHVSWRDRPILDLGCGTGLVGAALTDWGFNIVDGLDLSVDMMAVAERRGRYRHLIAADLNDPLPIATGRYGATICNGTFTSGHVGAGCLAEVARVIEPGGLLVCAVHHSVWEPLGFSTEFARLAAAGAIVEVEIVESAYYQSSTATDGRLCVFSVSSTSGE